MGLAMVTLDMENASSNREAGKWGDSPLLFGAPKHGQYFNNITYKKEMVPGEWGQSLSRWMEVADHILR